MPFSGVDDPKLPKALRGRSDKEKQVFVSTFNRAYSACEKKDGDCESRAYATAYSAMTKQKNTKGGDGSGHWDHRGVDGRWGGSAPAGRRDRGDGVDNYTGTPRIVKPDGKEEVEASARGIKSGLAKRVIKELGQKGGSSFVGSMSSLGSGSLTTEARNAVNYLVRKGMVILSREKFGEKGQSIRLTAKGKLAARVL